MLLYIREVGRCRKMDIYENVSRNANMIQHIRELERIGVLDVDEKNTPSTIRLTEKGVTIADLLMVISRTI